eukprot:TRINITY_DN43327_c0_g1_i1.p1 TRINITY_DN43327_c0_g1~~TRINITY_DN43327_c0_g1_i1.p1  ORF type:complete len:617 (+),score=122.35 TRINITY_DN43327_c0_g1_i1:85-1851(+)
MAAPAAHSSGAAAAVGRLLQGRRFLGGDRPSADDARLFDELCGGSVSVARWIRAVAAVDPSARAAWPEALAGGITAAAHPAAHPAAVLLGVGAGCAAPALPAGLADLKVGEGGASSPAATLRVPAGGLLLSPRAAAFLRKRRFVAWCRDDRVSSGLCAERFAAGVGATACPFAHVGDPALRGSCRAVLQEAGLGHLLDPPVRRPVPAASSGPTGSTGAPPPADPAELGPWVSDRLTVVLTTSVCPSNPSTQLLEAVLATFSCVPGLDAAKLVIVCDGCEVLGDSVRTRQGYKRAVVSAEASAQYELYKQRVRELAALRGGSTVVLELPSRHGFGWAVREALRKEVRTPFVMVIQHDRYFRKGFDLAAVLAAMEKDHRLGVVYMLNASLVDHLQKTRSRMNGRRLPDGADWEGEWTHPRDIAGIEVIPCLAWLDSTHVVRCSHLRDFVFGSRGVPATSGVPIQRGDFPEDKLNQTQIAAFRQEGFCSHQRFATWVLCSESPHVCHISGRAFKESGLSGRHVRGILDASPLSPVGSPPAAAAVAAAAPAAAGVHRRSPGGPPGEVNAVLPCRLGADPAARSVPGAQSPPA